MTSKERGDAFERTVKQTLELLPNSEVQAHVKIAGKDVDIVCVLPSALGAQQRIAVECKDYERPLTHAQASEALSGYYPILAEGKADQVLLVSRRGVVANAAELFDGKRIIHLTLEDLVGRVVNPGPIINGAIQRFHSLGPYLPAQAFEISLGRVAEAFDLFYSNFVSFCLQAPRLPFDTLRQEWSELTEGTPDHMQADEISDEDLGRFLDEHRSWATVDLQSLVDEWVHRVDIPYSLAVVGSYGTGKSTFARAVAHKFAANAADGQSRLPVLIELRNYSGQNLENHILSEIQREYGVEWTPTTFRSLNANGRLLLILDGFDEMKHGMTREALVYSFDQIAELQKGSAKIIICGRPTVFASDDEQLAILTGRAGGPGGSISRFIQLRIAPFHIEQAVAVLEALSKSRGTYTPEIAAKLGKLSELARDDREVASLLSRPVHLAMVSELLPSINSITKTDFRRASIYDAFIGQAVTRQTRRQQGAHPTALEHRSFAEDLALMMLARGESRSVRFSEITDEQIERFRMPGQSLEEVRRGFIAASFLDRKAPDVLYFSHKSFAEYLAASKIVGRLKTGLSTHEIPESVLTPDVLSFVFEMTTPQVLRKTLVEWRAHVRLLERLLHVNSTRTLEALRREDVTSEVAADLPKMPKMLAFQVLKAWASSDAALSSASARNVVNASRAILGVADGAIRQLAHENISAHAALDETVPEIVRVELP